MERYVVREARELLPQQQMRLFLGPGAGPTPRPQPTPPRAPSASRLQGENTLYLDRADYSGQSSSHYPSLEVHMTNEGLAAPLHRPPTNTHLLYAPTNPSVMMMGRPMVQGGEYQGYGNSGIDTSYLANYQTNKNYIPAMVQPSGANQFIGLPQQHAVIGTEYEDRKPVFSERTSIRQPFSPYVAVNTAAAGTSGVTATLASKPRPPTTEKTTNKVDGNTKPGPTKAELETKPKSRADIQKELFKDGVRVFAGPVEKIIKWHKILQDIGAMSFFEVVAKVVNVRQGEGCAKHVLVRDEGGPVLQLIYYEVDFLLPDLQPHCTIRVVGKMATGAACRLQAYSVRRATSDDVAALPRRAAVAAHQIAKMQQHYTTA